MVKFPKNPTFILVLCGVILLVILLFVPYIVQFINGLNYNDTGQKYYKEYPTTNYLEITPSNTSYFSINYPTTRLYIDVNTGNITALQPAIIDETNFSLYKQGRSYQIDPLTLNITRDINSNRFICNKTIEMYNYLLIKNNDIITTANVTIRMFIPMP